MENTVNSEKNIAVESEAADVRTEDTAQNIDNGGSVNISDEVVAVISSMAANEVDGVAGMVNSVAGGFAELLGMKNLSKGVKTVREGDDVTIYLAVTVEYGARIPDVSWNIQTKVKSDVEAMTGLNVKGVNISVDGITLVEKEQKQEKKEPEKPVEESAAEESADYEQL